MKICLLGGTGLLGSELKRVLTEQNFDFEAPTKTELNLLDTAATKTYLDQKKPDLIINCAAYTAVDKAETDKDACWALNVGLVETLISTGASLINFSTDYVFNAPQFANARRASNTPLPLGEDQGEGSLRTIPSPNPSQREGGNNEKIFEIPEDYSRDPQGVYGASKAAAEELLEKSNITWWNIRTSWLWGPGGENFVSTITELAKTKTELSIIDDQIGRPTYAPDLAAFVVDQFVRTQPGKGHYHLQNQGQPLSWAAWAEYFLRRQGWVGTIKKMSTAEYGAAAARPKNSILENTRLVQNLRDWENVSLRVL